MLKMWIKKTVTPKQMEDLLKCDKIEIRLETLDGSCSDVIECYTKKYINDTLL